MRKLADFIVDKRYLILALFIFLAGFGIFISTKVNINSDITKYLPKTSETRQGMDIMTDEFDEEDESSLYVMFNDITGHEEDILKQLEKIDNVDSVEYDNSRKFNKNGHTLYLLNVSANAKSEIAKNVYDDVNKTFEEYTLSFAGSIADANKPVLEKWIIATAIACAMIILIIMCDSYIEPFLFLFTIGLAVFINKGTNIIFPSVSNITDSICAILQMALSMDYSIMLMNRYTQEKKYVSSRREAMKRALHNSFASISSSSVTTIVGLMALVFMSFTIGKDLGYVLAKGVLLSLVCIFAVLPGLILMFDNLITKTRKRSINFKMNKLGVLSHNLRYVALGLIIVVFIISYILKGNLKILYTGSENDKVGKIFRENNQMAIIYNNKDEDKMAKICKEINSKQVNQVLCYGNTIGEKLDYNSLNTRLNDLGHEEQIDDYLLKLVFYNYYASNKNTKISTMELINFIEDNVYTKEKLDEKVDTEMKSNIEKLKYFASKEEINKLRTPQELAEILEIDQTSIKNLLTYHHAQKTNTRLSINQFVNYMYSDVLNNNTFKSSIDNTTKENLNTLNKFIDKNTLNTKYDYRTMANIFGINEKTMSDLYLYYYSVYGVDTTLTMYEFSSFILNDVVTNNTYSSLFTEDTINSLKLLNTYSNQSITNKEMNNEELANLLGIDKEEVELLLVLMHYEEENNNKVTLKQIKNISIDSVKVLVENIKDNKEFINEIDIEKIKQVIEYVKNKDINSKITKEDLEKINKEITDEIYEELEIKEDLTLKEFIELIKEKYNDKYNEYLKKINNIKEIYDDEKEIDYKELAEITGVDSKYTKVLYTYIDYKQEELTSTPKEVINYLLENKDNELISEYLDEEKINSLTNAKNIIDKSNNKYNYQTMSSVIGMDEALTRKLYSLYASNYSTLTLTKQQVINFILDNRNTKELSNIDQNLITKLELLKKVLNGVDNNTTYNSNEMSNLLNINNTNMKLLYSNYDISYGYTESISLKELTDFILTDVVTNQRFASSFNSDSKEKLTAINKIMDDSLNDVKYTSQNFYEQVSPLDKELNYNLVDLIYLYFGSVNDYSNKYKLTVEEFINYLNNNILNDEKFDEFIDSDMQKEIKNGKKSIDKAKKLLVGKNYSRVVINTNYEKENDETFEFIKDLKEQMSPIKHDHYLIGDSPMAYDLNKTFGSEFNFISILTMLLIFIVVAVTFKSFVIPLVLTLIIQCAVYITMGILSIFGGSVYFISLLIVQSILMGATIDYAILFTSYYIELRGTYNKKGSLINAYNKSIHTILTSASVLIIVTFIVGFFANEIAAKICMTISQGTLSSTILVLFILPAVLASLDKFIVKKN